MFGKAIDSYIVAAVLPYTALALSILSIIILIQQTSKFADVLGSSTVPLRLTLEVTLNLLPNILIFTLPMATLVGVATGYSRMSHDSELTAMRAAGVGAFRIILPALFVGASLSFLTLYAGFVAAPTAARNLRDIGLRAALYRLESPVEPRSFYTGMPGKVVYVREGDEARGVWEKIFIYWQETDGRTRLVTAKSGRLDFSGEQTELVLDDALMTTLPAGGGRAVAAGEHVTIEHSESMRVRDDRLNAGRNALARRIEGRELEFDEMGWQQLSEKSRSAAEPSVRREALLARDKRLTLGLSPIIFAFFGAALGLRAARGGRSQGILVSLASMLLYYLLSLVGEQLVRAGVLPRMVGSWLAFGCAILFGALLFFTRHQSLRLFSAETLFGRRRRSANGAAAAPKRYSAILGLLDRSILRSIAWDFSLTLFSLISAFLVFTLFELLRFIALNHTSAQVVARYFIFLLPFTFVAVAPTVMLLSVLITFTLLVRRSESVAWWASGQSVFRLILPSIFFAALLGAGVWLVQEKIEPAANRRQNILRGVIRTGAAQAETQPGRIWISGVESRRIYAFDPAAAAGQFRNLMAFDFDPEMSHLERLLIAPEASAAPSDLEASDAEIFSFSGQKVAYEHVPKINLAAGDFTSLYGGANRPGEFDADALSAYIKALKARGMNVQPLAVALEQKRAGPFFPLVMVFTGAPLAFLFGRRGTTLALCVGIGAGLAFQGITGGVQQAGESGLLSPFITAWAPSFLFLAVGVYLLTRSQI
ncbi:MAG TPA: LptF/LptG family permease [Pyrinomonadaceae bacterium]|jgi:LPS export ABC transporter permease LptG|nr:LptF/LptG family permease [Pyrinomonadaceae bacterium]